MPGKHKIRRITGADYLPLFERIEESFDPSEMTPSAIKKYINARTSGMEGLAEQLSLAKVINDEINKSTDLDELELLREDIGQLSTHQGDLLRDLEEKITAVSITLAQKLAEEKNIKLTERTRAKVENWSGKNVFVIREKGRFKSWKKV